MPADIILENSRFRLVIGENCTAKSLFCKTTGEECLAEHAALPLFSVTQLRPFNNEIKLAYPCKRTTYPANRIRMENDRLIIGFDIAPYEAVICVQNHPRYLSFSLERFIVQPHHYDYLKLDTPPAVEFCLLQLPIRDRTYFGDWLNVSWDDTTAINLLAAAPQTLIDAEKRDGYRILHAHVEKNTGLLGPAAALIVSETEQLLDAIADVEEDFDLPRGVQSRKNSLTNASIYSVGNLSPQNVEEHIHWAKKGGFRLMEINDGSFFQETEYWGYRGNYDFRKEYPNGLADVKTVLDKIKAAGIHPGFHFLHTHIGLRSRYVTPVADHRLNLLDRFTLSRPLNSDDTVIYVEQDPVGAPISDRRRVLKFGGELITYEGYTTEYPFCFTGCVRGAFETIPADYPAGFMGGVLDVSEYAYGGTCYLDQNSSLADEIADKLAATYNCGCEFAYFDGSEGTNAPYEYHIPNAQYRLYKKMQPPPLLCEGAARSHFSWHILSGGNAFDCFGPKVFKQMIRLHPAAEAPRMRQDFTRVNFGWWLIRPLFQPDMMELGLSLGIAWDCPGSLIADLEGFQKNPRIEDIFEVIHRWEDVRAKNWLSKEQKEALKNLEQEHILLINEQQEYELAAYHEIPNAAGEDSNLSAFWFTRNGENYVVYWHNTGSGNLQLNTAADTISVTEQLWEAPFPLQSDNGECCLLPAGKRRYVRSKLPVEKLIQLFQSAILTE